MRLLITGHAGFVGGHLIEYLRAEQPDVELFGLDRAAAPKVSGVRGFEVDLTDRDAVAEVLREVVPDRVVHLAGQPSVALSWRDPGATLHANVLGVVRLLEGLRQHAGQARLLVVGSADEYGVGSDRRPLSEAQPLRPDSPYAVSKAAQSLLAIEHARDSELRVVCTRTFPHTGPRRGAAFAESSFARQIAQIEAGQGPGVLEVGNLEAVRDFLDVRDVVRAYWMLLESAPAGQTYNVCSGRGVAIGEVLQMLIRSSTAQIEVRQDPQRLRPSDVPVLVGDPARLIEATGWSPRRSLEEALDDLLDYWRQSVR